MRAFRPLLGSVAVFFLIASHARAADPPSIKDRLRAALREAAENVDEIERVESRAVSLWFIGAAQVKLGDHDQARATLHRTLKLIADNQANENPSRFSVYSHVVFPGKIAADLARAGDASAARAGFRQAIEAAERIETMRRKERPPDVLAPEPVTERDEMRRPDDQGFPANQKAMLDIGYAQFQAGDRDLARATFERVVALDEAIPSDRFAIGTLCYMARVLWPGGDRAGAVEAFERAIRLAEALDEPPPAPALPQDLPRPIVPGPPAQPQKPPDPAGQAGPRAYLAEIARARLEVGDVDGALATLDDPKAPGTFGGADLVTVAAAIQADDRDAAARVLDRVRRLVAGLDKGYIVDRSEALREIARVQARLGDFDAALRTAEELGKVPERHFNTGRWAQSRTLLEIASVQLDAGLKADARKLPREAYRFLREAANAYMKQTNQPIPMNAMIGEKTGLGAIARAHARAGDLDGASQMIAILNALVGLNDENDPQGYYRNELARERVKTLVVYAIALAEAHDPTAAARSFHQAVDLAKSVKTDVRRRQDLITAIADAQAQVGDLDAALQTVRLFEDEPGGLIALSGLAGRRRIAGDIPAALRVADAIADEKYRNITLSLIAGSQAEVGDAEEALRLANRLDLNSRITALRQIVDGLEKREAKSKGSK